MIDVVLSSHARGARGAKIVTVVSAPTFRALATALEAGQSLEAVLSSPATQSAWPEPLRAALLVACRHGRVGEALVEAGVLDDGAAAIVDAGVMGGFVPEAFRQVADLLEERRRRRRQLLMATAYPAFLWLAACVLVPLPRIVSGGVLAWAAIAVPGVVVVVGVFLTIFVVLPRLPPTRQASVRGLWARAPLVGSLVVDDARGSALAALSRLAAAGLSWRLALPLSARASGLATIADQGTRAVAVVDAGGTLSAALVASELIRGSEQALVAVAEQTGSLPERLLSISSELAERSRRRALVVAGAVAVVVGIVVAVVVGVQIVRGFVGTFETLDAITRE
jgi:general secretion pathway protein F